MSTATKRRQSRSRNHEDSSIQHLGQIPDDHSLDLLKRLAAHDITYLHGPAPDNRYKAKSRVLRPDEISRLARDVSQSSDSRIRCALVALLLVHPEDLAAFRAAASSAEPQDRRWIEACILAAAALETRWWFSLWVYNRQREPMNVETEERRWGIVSVRLSYGEDALKAIAALLAEGQQFPIDYVGQWEDTARHALGILRTLPGLTA